LTDLTIPQYTGLDAELYDADYADYQTGDVEFYVEEAVRCGKPLLELGCGTGRIAIPIAEAGLEVVGVEISRDMLAVAQRKVAALAPEIAARITLIQGDMVDFSLDHRFDLAIVPFRTFLCLMTIEDQKRALINIRRHLNPDGRLILNFFDPDLREILDYNEQMRNVQKLMNRFSRPATGNQVVEWSSWDYNITEQTIEEQRNYVEYAPDGDFVKSSFVTLRIRYIFRWEMHHLLELCGYRIEALYGDFKRAPFRARGEQIWIARVDGGEG